VALRNYFFPEAAKRILTKKIAVMQRNHVVNSGIISNNSYMQKKFLFMGMLLAGLVIVGIGITSFNLSSSLPSGGCLSSGTWSLKKVYLDSMLYVNGSEKERLLRLDVTEMFLAKSPVTLSFTGDIGREIRNGTATITYIGTGYAIRFHAEGERLLGKREDCHKGMILSQGITLLNGTEITDTVRQGNQISIASETNHDHAGLYTLRNDTLYNNFNLDQWKPGEPNSISKRNPVGNTFTHYRNGNKIFRFVWVKI
jgi:hypothetical protein